MFRNQNSDRRIPGPLKVLFFLGMAALFVLVLGNVIMFLWNEILAEATGVKTLSFWEAIGLFVLARILFGGFRFGPRRHRPWRKKYNKGKRWREKWMNMSEEERVTFKQQWRERCGKRRED